MKQFKGYFNINLDIRVCSLQARHVGKIVVRTPTLQQQQQPAPGGVIVVSGGLGMIGSLVGAWLVRQGAPHVVLLGRSGRAGKTPLLLGCAQMLRVSHLLLLLSSLHLIYFTQYA